MLTFYGRCQARIKGGGARAPAQGARPRLHFLPITEKVRPLRAVSFLPFPFWMTSHPRHFKELDVENFWVLRSSL